MADKSLVCLPVRSGLSFSLKLCLQDISQPDTTGFSGGVAL